MFLFRYISDRNKIRNTYEDKFWILTLVVGMLTACNFRGDSESDDKDTLNVSKSQDTLLQDSLDNLKTDTALSDNPSSPDKANQQ